MHILLVCYNFPPNPGIGGRRWAKFAKYLARKGHTIHVISALRDAETASMWNTDVTSPNIINHRIPTHYPEYFQRPAHTVAEKLKFRLHTAWLRWTSKGMLYDASRFWKEDLLAKADELIRKHDIRNVIVTAPPFRLFCHMAEIKKLHPNVKLLFDYRDPWTKDVYAYGMQNLAGKDLAWERSLETASTALADVILSPYSHLLKYISENGTKAQLRELIHGFDPEDITVPSHTQPRRDDPRIQLVYGGAFYVGTEPLMETLAEALKELKTDEPRVYGRLNFSFYMDRRHMQSAFTASGVDIVKYHKPLPLQDYWQRVNDADICVLIYADYNKDQMTSKYFELISLRKPLLVLGPRGKAADFIEQNGLGLALEASDLKKGLGPAIFQMREPQFLNRSFDLTPYGYDHITDQLVSILEGGEK